MTHWKDRLTQSLEPILRLPDPRSKLSAYHDMPYAIFCYEPEHEFSLRAELSLLKTRLEQIGKRVHFISLAECLISALQLQGIGIDQIAEAEKSAGLEKTIETVHEIISNYHPLDQLVIERMPTNVDPKIDIVFITRAGALFPLYRTSTLLEQLMGKVMAPSVLFYPGIFDGAAGLRFMGILDAEHNYRPKIF